MKNLLYPFKLKALCVLLAMFVSVNYLLAQNTKQIFQGDKTEKKAEKSMYVIYEAGPSDFIYNKNNSLSIYKSDFERKTGYGSFDRFVQLNRAGIDSLVYKIIAPFFRNYKGKYSDNIGSFDISLFSKPDEKISEISLGVPRGGKVPLKAIEKLENSILNLGLRLELTEDGHKYVKDALWTWYGVMYSPKTLKKHLKGKDK